MALLDSTWLYYTLPWLYLVLLDSIPLYHDSNLVLHYSTMFYYGSTWLYWTQLQPTMHGCTWLCLSLLWHYLALPLSTMALNTFYYGSTWLYYSLPCMALLGSTWLYYSLPCMALLGCMYYILAWFYSYTLPWLYLTTKFYHRSTWLYYTIPWLYFTLHSTIAQHT